MTASGDIPESEETAPPEEAAADAAPEASPDPFEGSDPIDAVMDAGSDAPASDPEPAAAEADPFGDGSDPVDMAIAAGQIGPPVAGNDDDFDALGFDTGFGASPEGFATDPGGLGDDDDTPPGGIYVGEEVHVLDASTIGRALAEAAGQEEDHSLPDMPVLQRGLVGIDIGAAKAVVARFDTDGRHEIVPNQDDQLSTPAHIFFDEDGEQIVGREARAMAPSEPSRAVTNLKESLADHSDTNRWKAGEDSGESLNPEEVLTILMRHLLRNVEEHTGEPATHVALAAPAWFGDHQRESLRKAVLATGVSLVGITTEALAATVPYSLRLPDLRPRLALVFDMGHAALGIAIVRCGHGDIEVLAEEADRALGSWRWDRLLADEGARKFEERFGFDPRDDDGARIDLALRAEDAKRELSQRAQVTLVVSAREQTLKVGFTRQGFEAAAKQLIEHSRALLQKVRDDAGVDDWAKLDAVIMTGGGSRTPSLRRMLAKETGKKPKRGVAPEEGVAVGSLYWGIGARHALEHGGPALAEPE